MKRVVFACDRCEGVTPAIDSVFVRRASGPKLRLDLCAEHLATLVAALGSNGTAPNRPATPATLDALYTLPHRGSPSRFGRRRHQLLRTIAAAGPAGMEPPDQRTKAGGLMRNDSRRLLDLGLMERTGRTQSTRWHVTDAGRRLATLPLRTTTSKGAHAR